MYFLLFLAIIVCVLLGAIVLIQNPKGAYKKLLLKFPEKSSYFVAQIELLEKKSTK